MDLARPELGPPRPLNPFDRCRVPRFAGPNDPDHVRRASVGLGQLARLIDTEHLPVAERGGVLRKGGGWNGLSPPARKETAAPDTGRRDLDGAGTGPAEQQ